MYRYRIDLNSDCTEFKMLKRLMEMNGQLTHPTVIPCTNSKYLLFVHADCAGQYTINNNVYPTQAIIDFYSHTFKKSKIYTICCFGARTTDIISPLKTSVISCIKSNHEIFYDFDFENAKMYIQTYENVSDYIPIELRDTIIFEEETNTLLSDMVK